MGHKKGVYEKYIKRPQDFCVALAAIIVLSPILLITALLVRIKLGSPVIFKQKRPGLNEKIFTLYKFRTMLDALDKNGQPLPDGERLTSFGKKLRMTSLDELPELWNILKGDMSLVGPRPQLVRDMVFMSERQRQRHNVRPGLTGLAQVSGRNGITWEERLEYDLAYIQTLSLGQDIKILLRTAAQILSFSGEGVNTEGMDTAEDLGDYLLRTCQIDRKAYFAGQRDALQLIIDEQESGSHSDELIPKTGVDADNVIRKG